MEAQKIYNWFYLNSNSLSGLAFSVDGCRLRDLVFDSRISTWVVEFLLLEILHNDLEFGSSVEFPRPFPESSLSLLSRLSWTSIANAIGEWVNSNILPTTSSFEFNSPQGCGGPVWVAPWKTDIQVEPDKQYNHSQILLR